MNTETAQVFATLIMVVMGLGLLAIVGTVISALLRKGGFLGRELSWELFYGTLSTVIRLLVGR